MKWKNDEFIYEKYLLLDAIIEFGNKFRDKDASKISLSELTDFIEKFMDKKNETHIP